MHKYNRIIPVLLIDNRGLYKTINFKNPNYIGDPINAVKIFNEKEVDEIVILDITATSDEKPIQYELIGDIVSEAFMPICYGGGIKKIDQIKKLLKIGIEKVSINSCAVETPGFIKEVSHIYGSSTIVVSVDVKRNIFGKYFIFKNRGSYNTGINPIEFCKNAERMGAGEIILTSINNEGMMNGYDLLLLKNVTESVSIPVIANGGAGCIDDFNKAINIGGASAVSAGSLFVYYGKHKAVLINYPYQDKIIIAK